MIDTLTKQELTNVLVQLFNITVQDVESEKLQASFIPDIGAAVVGAVSKNEFKRIANALREVTLTEDKLIKTFYKRWSDVTDKSRFELLVDQVLHYLTTYGQLCPGYMYIPNENFDASLEIESKTVPVRVITAVDGNTAKERLVEYINSGIALEVDTLEKVLSALRTLGYEFGSSFKNKEANIFVAEQLGIMPSEPEEFLRFVLYKATGNTLLIKNQKSINDLRAFTQGRSYLLDYVERYGVDKLASVFNRFKPLILALKDAKPYDTISVVNKISKRSKKVHKPLPVNPLSVITSRKLKATDQHWLENATTWALLRAIDALVLARSNPESHMYRVRNGKMWAHNQFKKYDNKVLKVNFGYIYAELKNRVNGEGKVVYIPSNVDFGLPTTEKAFVGNLPALTKISGKTLNVGMYWENSYGARDLDLSSMDISGNKIGWNSGYYNSNSSVIYSGDITNAPNGAVEYLRFSKDCGDHLVHLNVYSGDSKSDYDLIVGESSKRVASDKMMDTLIASARKTTRNKESILGFVSGNTKGVEFVVTDYEGGTRAIASSTEQSRAALNALKHKAKYRTGLKEVLVALGYQVVDSKTQFDEETEEEVERQIDVDLSLDNLSKDSIMSLFS